MANLKSLFKRLGGYGDNVARSLIEDNAGRAVMSSDLLDDAFLDALEESATHVPATGSNDIHSLFSGLTPPTEFNNVVSKADNDWLTSQIYPRQYLGDSTDDVRSFIDNSWNANPTPEEFERFYDTNPFTDPPTIYGFEEFPNAISAPSNTAPSKLFDEEYYQRKRRLQNLINTEFSYGKGYMSSGEIDELNELLKQASLLL